LLDEVGDSSAGVLDLLTTVGGDGVEDYGSVRKGLVGSVLPLDDCFDAVWLGAI